MEIKLVPREQTRAAWLEHDRVHVRAQLDATRPGIVGASEAVALVKRREFVFRNVSYTVPPLPWPLAVELLDVQEKVRTLGANGGHDAALDAFTRAARLSRAACKPAGRIRRLFWAFTPNPFLKATPWEVGRHLGFFCTYLALDGGPQLADLERFRSGISPPSSAASSRATLPGPARTASRGRGATS